MIRFSSMFSVTTGIFLYCRNEFAPDANIRHRPLLLEEIDKYVTVIGDASKVSTITNAVYEGYHVALDI